MEIPGAGDVPPTGAEVEAAFEVAPAGHPEVHRQRAEGDALNLIFRTGRGRPRGARRRGARDPRHRRPAARGGGHAVGARGGRRRPARQPRGEPDPPHLPRDPLRVPLPRGAAAQHRARAAVDGAGADRGGRRLARGLRARPEAQPAHRGRRAARRRGVHGVHLADPPAVRGGATPRLHAEGGGRRHGRRAPGGPSSCRP